MNAKLTIQAAEEQSGDRERQEGTVRRIGEILPLVMARYQLGGLDCLREVSEEFSI